MEGNYSTSCTDKIHLTLLSGQRMPAIFKVFACEKVQDARKTMEDAIRMPRKYFRMPEDAKEKLLIVGQRRISFRDYSVIKLVCAVSRD